MLRNLYAIIRFIVTFAFLAFLVGLCVGVSGCRWVASDDQNTADALTTWQARCRPESQKWSVAADNESRQHVFIVVCDMRDDQ